MDHAALPDARQSKGAMSWHRYHGDEPVHRPSDRPASPFQDEMRPIRRVRSPSRPRAWLSKHDKPNYGRQLHRSRDDHSPYDKAGFGHRTYPHFQPRTYFPRRDNFQSKHQHLALRDREQEREKERYEQEEGCDRSSPPKQNSSTRPFLPRSTSSRGKDTPYTAGQSNRNQSRGKDQKATKSKGRERSREGELPSTASQMAARDRAIQQKRREIDEAYYQECEMFGLVVKMLIAKDQSLERSIQSSLQENLRDIGKHCVEAMEKFIEDYDSREASH